MKSEIYEKLTPMERDHLVLGMKDLDRLRYLTPATLAFVSDRDLFVSLIMCNCNEFCHEIWARRLWDEFGEVLGKHLGTHKNKHIWEKSESN